MITILISIHLQMRTTKMKLIFSILERYNYHKCEALRLADLKVKYTSSKIKEIARIICNIGKRRTERVDTYSKHNDRTNKERHLRFGIFKRTSPHSINYAKTYWTLKMKNKTKNNGSYILL